MIVVCGFCNGDEDEVWRGWGVDGGGVGSVNGGVWFLIEDEHGERGRLFDV